MESNDEVFLSDENADDRHDKDNTYTTDNTHNDDNTYKADITHNADNTESNTRQRKRSIVHSDPPDLDTMAKPGQHQTIAEGLTNGGRITPSDQFLRDETYHAPQDGHEHDKHKQDISHAGHEGRNVYVDKSDSPSHSPNNAPNNREVTDNGILYDDTKPKRLPNPRKFKLSVDEDTETKRRARATSASPRSSLHDSISILISPDEPDSPPKRRRRLPETRDDYRQDYDMSRDNTHNSDVNILHTDTNRFVPDIEKGEHYQRSPELARRKLSNRTSVVANEHNQTLRCSSPVERLITKHGLHDTTSNVLRKHSSDARLVGNRERIKPPPQRKVSLEARIEAHRYNEAPNSAEQFRRRKVSFDTTALVNGSRFMPLNDEIALSDRQEIVTHDEDQQHYPTDGMSQFKSDLRHENQEVGEEYIETNVDDDCKETVNEFHDYYDNKAYVEDEVQYNDIPLTNSQNSYDHNGMRYDQNTNQRPTTQLDDRFQTSYSTPQSASDGKIKRSSTQSNDSGLPKSILKLRKEDTDSMVSEDSLTSNRAFKLRKDSIALFTDKNGEVQLQALRKEYSNPWRRFGKRNIKQMWAERHETLQKYKLHLFVLLLFSMTLIFVAVGLHFHSKHHENLEIAKRIFFNARKRIISIVDPEHRDAFLAMLGQDIPAWQQPTHCYSNYKDIHDRTCLKWKDHATLNIVFSALNDTNCYTIRWDLEDGRRFYDCFHLSNSYWYGPSNISDSQWPLENSKFVLSDSRSNFHGSGTFSHAFEYYWLSSAGAVILVQSKVPLEINWNTKRHHQVCFLEVNRGAPDNGKVKDSITYTMCNGVNMRDTHETIREKYFPKVTSLPKKYLLEKPHWSTAWESSQFAVNETIVTNLIHNLTNNSLDCSAIEIDGKWEKHYGELVFDRSAFPNVSKVINEIASVGCKASLNIYPYVSFQSEPVINGRLTYDYFIKDKSKTVPALVQWQHELGAMLDVSNPKAMEWLRGKLNNITDSYDLRTFRLSYGVSDWFPHDPTFNASDATPKRIKFLLTDVLTSFGEIIVQSTADSQNITTLIGISSDIETDSKTGVSCISNIIPNVLSLGMVGYSFVMADGFGIERKLNQDTSKVFPTRSLFMRWMQMSSFMPAMRYTIKPWSYDPEVVELSKNLTQFHKDKIIKLFYDFEPDLLQGEPFIQPLWWLDPYDPDTYKIGDQFVVAGKYLVAPILCDDSSHDGYSYRDIYVPRGLWLDLESKAVATGPKWLANYKASEFTVPYFEKMPELQNGFS